MKRAIPLTAAVVFLVGCQSATGPIPKCADTIPVDNAPAAAAPTPTPAPTAEVATATPAPTADFANAKSSVADTTWNFCGKSDGTTDGITFHADGTLESSKFNCGHAHWQQSGDHVTFDCNNFTVFEAVITAPNKMGGTWHRTAKPEEKFPTCLDKSSGGS